MIKQQISKMYVGYIPYAYVVFLIIFCVFGIAGNVFVIILVLVLKKYKKSTTHLYILQLAVADFFFLGFIPFSVIDELEGGNWRFGNGLCKATRGIRYINFYASVMFMTVMSVDRYIALCRSSSDTLQKLRTPIASIIISSVVWLISVSLSIPVIYFTQTDGIQPECTCDNKFLYEDELYAVCLKLQGSFVYTEIFCKQSHPLDEGRCRYEIPDYTEMTNPFDPIDTVPTPPLTPSGKDIVWASYVWFNFIGMFILPILVMCACYGLIVTTFRQKSLPTGSQNGCKSGIDNQQRLTLICIIFVATFFCCWISDHIFLILGLYQDDFDGHFFLARTAMTYINSALNPYLYTFMGPGFKQKWRSIRQHFSRRRINSLQSLTTKIPSAIHLKDVDAKGNQEEENSNKLISKV